ncbi:MAG: shikimate kinase [Kiritimatiellae bacterium]|nr:shikimate kinase [Kiritimatiellia bacterium]
MIHDNIVLIGMPGAGKSTIGVMLAKRMAKDFIDTDVLIQVVTAHSLQHILDENGYLGLRDVEEKVILSLDCDNHVIATGGSAAYSDRAMHHLASQGTTVFLDVSFDVIETRVNDFGTRGIARREDQSFRDLFEERRPLYERYAEIAVECGTKNQDEVCDEILARMDRQVS